MSTLLYVYETAYVEEKSGAPLMDLINGLLLGEHDGFVYYKVKKTNTISKFKIIAREGDELVWIDPEPHSVVSWAAVLESVGSSC